MYISIPCELASLLLGAALARMRPPYLVHDTSYGPALRKRSTRARLRAHAMDAQACSLARDDSYTPFALRSVRDEAS
jgi:hypothetical protein